MGHIKMARPGFVPKKITNKQEPKPLFSPKMFHLTAGNG
jgi:hypothetical protein